uniref:Cytochrome b5 heme-binding domain-containing protein n=1 Tax=Oryza sativa subsp. japonica TaxID=39947 RepID=Q6ERI4_ORYSJ|nr:hypothetical protein [Oryza sativa Japonica Group]BAD28736.1 hypothetical protein [Oryza sativa Japonica Group]
MQVYDVTSYVEEHPGGDEILNNAGATSKGNYALILPVNEFPFFLVYSNGIVQWFPVFEYWSCIFVIIETIYAQRHTPINPYP